jgi:hypothetical protein
MGQTSPGLDLPGLLAFLEMRWGGAERPHSADCIVDAADYHGFLISETLCWGRVAAGPGV